MKVESMIWRHICGHFNSLIAESIHTSVRICILWDVRWEVEDYIALPKFKFKNLI